MIGSHFSEDQERVSWAPVKKFTRKTSCQIHLIMKRTFGILAVILTFGQSEATVANFLADRALAKLSQWIAAEGSVWLTVPGHFQQGQVNKQGKKFTLAFAGPKLASMGELVRSGDAILDGADPDPLHKSKQKLHFKATLANVTMRYENVAYSEDDFGSHSFIVSASTNSTTVDILLDIKGGGETCFGFLDTIHVDSNGTTSISMTVGDTDKKVEVPAVIGAISSHFQNSVVENLQTLLESGTFSSLENYDICNDKKDTLPPANVMAEKIVSAMGKLVAKHSSDWTHLPGSWKQYFAPNGTLIYYIAAGFGNITDGGSMKIIDASYTNDNSNLNIVFETDSLSAIYGDFIYVSNWVKYKMVETVKTKKLKTSMSVSFSPEHGSGIPTCYGGSVGTGVYYEGGELDIKNLTPGVPHDVQSSVKSQISNSFTNDVISAAEELYNTVVMNVLPEVCTHST